MKNLTEEILHLDENYEDGNRGRKQKQDNFDLTVIVNVIEEDITRNISNENVEFLIQ